MTPAAYYSRQPTGSQAYGAPRPNGRTHTGDDFSHSTRPDTVRVPYLRAGRVTSIQRERPGLPNGYGNQVQVTHDDGSRFSYSHLGRVTASVGEHVTTAGSPGTEGTTGATSGPCMHLEHFTRSGARVDPWPYVISALAAGAGGGSKPLPIPIPPEDEDDEMRVFTKPSDGASVYEIRNGKKRGITAQEWEVTKAAYKVAGEPLPYANGTLTKADLAKIPNA
jgi:murein DD-endopeptidase MepM/ murein hydrolase activator NlpD